MTGTRTLRGVALLKRGAEDLVAVTGGTTGPGQDTDCTLGTRFQIASVTKQFTAAAPLPGQVIERAAAQPYGAFLGREIFEPLGMAATFNGNPGDQPHLAAGHHRRIY